MAVETTTAFSGPYTANGATTTFGFTFIAKAADEIGVLLRDSDGVDSVVSTSAYTVTLNANGTGSVVFTTAPATGNSVYIYSDVSFQQSIDFEDGTGWKAAPVNEVSDRAALRDIYLKNKADRSFVVPYGETGFTLPTAAERQGLYLAFDADGDAVTSTGTGADAGLRTDLADDSGSSLSGFLQSGAGAVARSVQSKLRDIVSVKDFGAVGDGVTDDTAAIQAAITAGNVTFPPGDYVMSWAAISADVTIPANRKIEVQKGATITNTGGRFTAENVDNVEWQIDGWVKSVAMRTAASKPLWTASVGERGFIEFAEDYSAGSAASGFKVHGTGKVSGDWTGTPNVSDPSAQVNRKGIACWNAKNVLVSGLEVFGFDGEAVYASFFDEASHNIVFEKNNVHDTRFNALNFNAGANGGGCFIRNNRVANAFSVEMSAGSCVDNYVEGMIGSGIWTGSGAGYGQVVISRNTIIDCGSAEGINGIGVTFASGTPVTGIEIHDNTIVNSYGNSIVTDYVREFSIKGNRCIGTAQGVGGYDIGVNNSLRGTVAENTFMSPGSFAQAARVYADPANCYDVSICPTTNVYKATTGSASPATGNGVQTIASAAALLVPALGKIFRVSGTTTITSIATALLDSNFAGREITLIFNDALTFTDGSNLKLAGNFVTTADDTITLVCDGTNWFEVCRSVN